MSTAGRDAGRDDALTGSAARPTRPVAAPANPASELGRLHDVVQAERLIGGDLMKVYGTERALARIADSDLAQHLVLKGGYLLRQVLPMGIRRTTVDADFFCSGVARGDVIARMASALATRRADDHVGFDPRSLDVEPMQDDDGMRLTFKGSIGRSIIDGMIDIGFSAALVPKAQRRRLMPMLRHAAPLELTAYSIETVVAEKFETVLRRGRANTRLKDFYDLAMLARHLPFAGERLCAALAATCSLRGTGISSDRPTALLPAYTEHPDHVAAWGRLARRAPKAYEVTLRQAGDEIWRFLEPPMRSLAVTEPFGAQWSPAQARWEPVAS